MKKDETATNLPSPKLIRLVIKRRGSGIVVGGSAKINPNHFQEVSPSDEKYCKLSFLGARYARIKVSSGTNSKHLKIAFSPAACFWVESEKKMSVERKQLERTIIRHI